MGVIRLQAPATLREATVEHLREQIVTGALEPGEILRDGEVAAQLGLSPTPVREALVQLAGAGLVEIESNKQKRVTPLNLITARELAAVQRILWQTGYAWGAPNVGPAALDALGSALTAQEEALNKQNVRAALLAHTDFHSIVVAAAGNSELNRLIVDRYPLLERLILLRLPHFINHEMLDRNRAIYHALGAADSERAIAIGETIRAGFAEALDLLLEEEQVGVGA
jgi:DNA-binding GntR family transcriptional regulator